LRIETGRCDHLQTAHLTHLAYYGSAHPLGKTMKLFAAAIPAIAMLVSAPAQAETEAEFEGYLRKVIRNVVRSYERCVDADLITRSCGESGGAIVCDMNALTIIAGESGLLERYAAPIADVTNLVADTEGYLNDLIEAGHMADVAAMSPQRMRDYCATIGSAVRL
jgi:hypothetical protein